MEHMGAIMATCSYCGGSGIEVYDEDDQRIEADCYHCCGTGAVDDETAFHDYLASVATIMAQTHVSEFKRHVNENPDGEGFDFMAAEDMMTPWDFERSLVYSYVGEFMERLNGLSFEEQREYVRKMIEDEGIEPLY